MLPDDKLWNDNSSMLMQQSRTITAKQYRHLHEITVVIILIQLFLATVPSYLAYQVMLINTDTVLIYYLSLLLLFVLTIFQKLLQFRPGPPMENLLELAQKGIFTG